MTELEALQEIMITLQYLEKLNEQTEQNLKAISASLNLRVMEADETWNQITI